ncbi:MAG TPA: SWIM zinc finger family protein [Candidatus Dormibacteraeota bacterium]|nr:SWIM zinc finger family protein [Candidatus Dormibacteraeota bacterium]
MTITTANNRTAGLRTFYVESETHPERPPHVVQHIRRAGMNRWSCSCPDFIFRGQVKASHKSCKHIRAVREMANAA